MTAKRWTAVAALPASRVGATSGFSLGSFIAAADPRLLADWVMRRCVRNQTVVRTRQPQTLACLPTSSASGSSN